MSNSRVTIEPGSVFTYVICLDGRVVYCTNFWWRAKMLYKKLCARIDHPGWAQ